MHCFVFIFYDINKNMNSAVLHGAGELDFLDLTVTTC